MFKVRWAIEGDANTKFFHGIINSKRSQLAICETFVNGEWIVDPLAVKSVFLKYFSTHFFSPVSPRICFADQFTNRLSLEQQADLERNVSNKEIKSVVWDCGTNKTPGPDGFTFDSFILNELLSLCKHKKFKAMVFKVDFEKAFDSIRCGDEEEQFGFLLSRMNGLILTNISGRWNEVVTRWVKVMPIKINVFAWRVRLDKLPTWLNLSLKAIDISTIVCLFVMPLSNPFPYLLFLSNGSSFMDETYALVRAR
nr:RNA-directed DNA polymerase, eukaryota [Tanacetum cinerariifolium]